MCMGKPKVTNVTQAAPAVASTQEMRAPSQAAVLINSTERARRRQGYAALLRANVTGAPATTAQSASLRAVGGKFPSSVVGALSTRLADKLGGTTA